MGNPQPGQTAGCSNVVPHRVQNFEFSSIAGFPQVGQVMLFLIIGPPHLSQNCASGSATIAPHVLQTGNCGSGSSMIADPHRLQNFDSPSGAGIPQLPHFLAIFFLSAFMGHGHKPCGSGGDVGRSGYRNIALSKGFFPLPVVPLSGYFPVSSYWHSPGERYGQYG